MNCNYSLSLFLHFSEIEKFSHRELLYKMQINSAADADQINLGESCWNLHCWLQSIIQLGIYNGISSILNGELDGLMVKLSYF